MFFLETFGVRGAEVIPIGVDFKYFSAVASPAAAILSLPARWTGRPISTPCLLHERGLAVDYGVAARSAAHHRRPRSSTRHGAARLPIAAGDHYSRAGTAGAFAEATLQLLATPAEAAEMAENAYDFVLKRYSTRRVARTFEDICKRAALAVGVIPPAEPVAMAG